MDGGVLYLKIITDSYLSVFTQIFYIISVDVVSFLFIHSKIRSPFIVDTFFFSNSGSYLLNGLIILSVYHDLFETREHAYCGRHLQYNHKHMLPCYPDSHLEFLTSRRVDRLSIRICQEHVSTIIQI